MLPVCRTDSAAIITRFLDFVNPPLESLESVDDILDQSKVAVDCNATSAEPSDSYMPYKLKCETPDQTEARKVKNCVFVFKAALHGGRSTSIYSSVY